MSELSCTDSYKYIEESFDHALQHHPGAFQKTPYVTFELFVSGWDGVLRMEVLTARIALAGRLPAVTFKIVDHDWFLDAGWKGRPSALLSFLVGGRKKKAALTEAGHDKNARN